jgi:hypothetical protein
MNEFFTIEVELPVAGKEQDEVRYIEIKVNCEYSVENDGIGPYEYWGSKEIDHGINYAVIDNTDWDTAGFTKEEIDLINIEIDKNLKAWEVEIIKRVVDSRSYCAFYQDGD